MWDFLDISWLFGNGGVKTQILQRKQNQIKTIKWKKEDVTDNATYKCDIMAFVPPLFCGKTCDDDDAGENIPGFHISEQQQCDHT